jgi:hypothetical protein
MSLGTGVSRWESVAVFPEMNASLDSPEGGSGIGIDLDYFLIMLSDYFLLFTCLIPFSINVKTLTN